MDPPQEYFGDGNMYQSQPNQRSRSRPRGRQQSQGFSSTELYEDVSPYATQQTEQSYSMQNSMNNTPQMFPGQQIMNDPMANMAMQYGAQFVPAGKDFVEKKIDHFLSVSKLKFYFGVDTAYVIKKLGLLVFPYAHQDWSLKYDKSEPVEPKLEVNAPDLYIPSMAFVTYVLVCSWVLGTQNRFTPEQLGMIASSTLVWLFIELMIIIMTLYVMGISAQVKYLDLLALCGYKYVGMILAGLAGLLFKSFGYYCVLLYTSISVAFYIARSLRLLINPDNQGNVSHGGSKRRLYILLFISLTQPVMMYFLTRHLNEFDAFVPKV